MIEKASMVCLGGGALLLFSGLVWLLIEAIQILLKPREPEAGPTATKVFGLAEILNALTDMFRELRKHPPPFRLIFGGFALTVIGAGLALAAPAAPSIPTTP